MHLFVFKIILFAWVIVFAADASIRAQDSVGIERGSLACCNNKSWKSEDRTGLHAA
jgi:hypothetical protein